MTQSQMESEIARRVLAGQPIGDLLHLIRSGVVAKEPTAQLCVHIPKRVADAARRIAKAKGVTMRSFVSQALEIATSSGDQQ